MRQRQRQLRVAHDVTQAEHIAERIVELEHQLAQITARKKAAEEELIALCGRLPSEGTVTRTFGVFKVKIKTRLNRRLDQKKVQRVHDLLDERTFNRVFPVKRTLSVRELHWLEDNDPDAYKAVRRTFTASRGKPTIAIVKENV